MPPVSGEVSRFQQVFTVFGRQSDSFLLLWLVEKTKDSTHALTRIIILHTLPSSRPVAIHTVLKLAHKKPYAYLVLSQTKGNRLKIEHKGN